MMATACWEAFWDLLMLQDRMNRACEDLPRRSRPGTAQEDMAAGQWTPPVDIVETPESLVILADGPGIGRHALDVVMKDKSLSIQGERRFEEERGHTYHGVERAYGNFRRVFSLPIGVRHDHIQAALRTACVKSP
jgi:HSP20 family protein